MRTAQARILIVDNEYTKHSILEEKLIEAGYSVVTIANSLEAAQELAKSTFEVVVTDIRASGRNGLSFLQDIKKQNPTQAAIVLTACGSIEAGVEAMKLGAFDSLQKPFSIEELLLKLDKLLQYEQTASENEKLRSQLALRRIENQIVGQSQAIRETLQRIHAAATKEATILIEGESGTEKELIAHILHENSLRAAGPFVAVACTALAAAILECELFGPESGTFIGAAKQRAGRFELAQDGTLFLDDVDEIPLDVQARLVRVLDGQAYPRVGGELHIPANVRVIAATKRSLSDMVTMGTFREDLFSKLNAILLKVPPLRERTEDIPLLVEDFLRKFALKIDAKQLTFSSDALAKLQGYAWPENIRELEGVLGTTVALAKGDRVEAYEVPELAASKETSALLSLNMSGIDRVDIGSILEDLESHLIRWALEKAKGNLARAAEMLGLPRSTLQYKTNRRLYSDNSLPGSPW